MTKTKEKGLFTSSSNLFFQEAGVYFNEDLRKVHRSALPPPFLEC